MFNTTDLINKVIQSIEKMLYLIMAGNVHSKRKREKNNPWICLHLKNKYLLGFEMKLKIRFSFFPALSRSAWTVMFKQNLKNSFFLFWYFCWTNKLWIYLNEFSCYKLSSVAIKVYKKCFPRIKGSDKINLDVTISNFPYKKPCNIIFSRLLEHIVTFLPF